MTDDTKALTDRLRAQAERHEALAASVGRRKDDLAADTLEWKAAAEIDRLQAALDAAEVIRKRWQDDYYRMDSIATGERERAERAECNLVTLTDSSSTALAEAVQRAREDVKEACAKVADAYRDKMDGEAREIRARGENADHRDCMAQGAERVSHLIRALHLPAPQPVNLPFERVPVCACDPGRGPKPTSLQILECKARRGPCSPQNNDPQTPTNEQPATGEGEGR